MMLEPLAVKLLDKHYELEDALTLEREFFFFESTFNLKKIKSTQGS